MYNHKNSNNIEYFYWISEYEECNVSENKYSESDVGLVFLLFYQLLNKQMCVEGLIMHYAYIHT